MPCRYNVCLGHKKKNPAKGPRLALCGVPSLARLDCGSVVELQSELDLPRIVGSIAGGTDSSKVAVRPIGRAGNRNHAVAAEAGSIEVRMVEDVEDFRSELELTLLVERNVLEEGQVKPVEARSRNLRYAAQ